MKRVLILGANGFIGQALCHHIRKTAFIVGYDRNPSMDPSLCDIYLQRDFSNDNSFFELLEEHRIDTIYHLISPTVPTEGTATIQNDINDAVLPTIRLLEAMKDSSTKKIIFASSGGTVYGESVGVPHTVNDELDPICAYAVQKIIIEKYLSLFGKIHGIKTIVARISNPYGVMPQNDRTQGIIPIFLKNLINKQPIVLFGNTVRDYIFIDDLVSALVKLNEYTGDTRVFNIGSGKSTYLETLVPMIEEIIGQKFSHITHQEIRKCDVKECALDIEETTKELRWIPTISLSDGIQKTFDKMRIS